ncbi:MAG: DUF3592 domain-containing protein [Lachnospiraceae bacterium]|nr:DUF3592 domain-containing protein [Lachnospiraceae bacterium]
METSLGSGLIFWGIYGLVGIVFFTIGILLIKNRKKKEKNCTSITHGRVRESVLHKDYNVNGGWYDTGWHPVFEYTVGDETIVKESKFGNSEPQFKDGQLVTVHYNPNKHDEFYVEEEKVHRVLSYVFTAVGAISLSAGIILFIVYR